MVEIIKTLLEAPDTLPLIAVTATGISTAALNSYAMERKAKGSDYVRSRYDDLATGDISEEELLNEFNQLSAEYEDAGIYSQMLIPSVAEQCGALEAHKIYSEVYDLD